MAGKKRPKLIYRASRYVSSHPFEQFALEIRAIDEYDSDSEICNITWQANMGEDEKWYAFTVNTSFRNRHELDFQYRQMSRILSYEMGYSTVPEDILDALDKVKAVEVIYDSRIYPHWVALTEVLPPEINRWGDDYNKLGNRNAMSSVLAATEEEAQGKMLAYIAEHFPDKVDAFKRAGMPVMIFDFGSKYTDIKPARELAKR